MQQILLNTESEEHTVHLGQTGPCKGYCLNTWGGDHGRYGKGSGKERGEERE